MATYRDDLEAARLRLRALEDRLEERDTELVELRKQLEKRSRPRVDTGKSWWRAIAIFLGTVAVTAGALAAMSASNPQQRGAPTASASDALVEAPTPTRVNRQLIPTRYPNFEASKRYLVVEACGDAPLTHVELHSSEGTFAFAELAVLRAR